MRRDATWVSLLLAATLWSSTAAADDWEMDFTPLIPVSISWIVSAPLAGAGAVVGAYNIKSIRAGRRPVVGQLVAGYGLGGLLLGNGVLNLTYSLALFEGGGGETYRGISIAVGSLSLAAAAFDLVTTIWAHAQPRPRAAPLPPRVGLAPLVATDHHGRATAGLLCRVSF